MEARKPSQPLGTWVSLRRQEQRLVSQCSGKFGAGRAGGERGECGPFVSVSALAFRNNLEIRLSHGIVLLVLR